MRWQAVPGGAILARRLPADHPAYVHVARSFHLAFAPFHRRLQVSLPGGEPFESEPYDQDRHSNRNW